MAELRQLQEKAGRFKPEKLSGNLQPPYTKAHMLEPISRAVATCTTLLDRLPDAPGKTGGNALPAIVNWSKVFILYQDISGRYG
ncbi:MAG: hypothetical protein K6E31_03275 [bacterium]|nr:hypothetical protein [bacterium]